jgi:hypothetical protein
LRPTYAEELERLAHTYTKALRFDIGNLVEFNSTIAGQSALFVASGGGLAVAQLAAERHIALHGELATAVTPLTLVGEGTVRHAAVIAISARAAHPDVSFALRAARTRHNYPVALVTHRRVDELDPSLAQQLTTVIHVPSAGRDGFLATNSVLALATLFVRAADPELDLPAELPYLRKYTAALERPMCLILYGPGQRSAAIDLETRLSELGLAAAQVADYRNFAHGRHTGFERHREETTVVAFASPATENLAQATLSALPDDAHIVRLISALPDPIAQLDLLAASMRLVGTTAEDRGVEPAQPKVPLYGRKLYHLAAQRYLSIENHSPVDRKLAAIRAPSSRFLRHRYETALDDWLDAVYDTHFRAVVIDYDGTVCSTPGRFELPPENVRSELLRLLDDGCHIGFATGRGRSLRTDIQKWVPRVSWPHITLGLYNGHLIERLDQPKVAQAYPGPLLIALQSRLEREPMSELVKIKVRVGQVSIEPITGSGIGVDTIVQWLGACIARVPRLELKLLRSGHSVDIVEPSTTKVAVIDAVEGRVGGSAMAIGDRGDTGGNDFELLAARSWTLSVDRCSADPTRCWNLAPPGATGPEALVSYLRHFRRHRDMWRLQTRSI